jgi:glycosyltransferase involved in cell wall biosynthesis
MARVAVVMSAFNRSPYLGEAVESVLEQTFKDWTLTIVDDCSQDMTWAMASAFTEVDGRIRLLRNEVNQGAGASLDRGVRYAIVKDDPEFVCWVDSDDLIDPDAISRTLAYLEKNPDKGMVYTRFRQIDSDGKLSAYQPPPRRPYSRDNLLIESMVFHFRLIRTGVYVESGGIDPNLRWAIDYDLMLRISEGYDIGHLDEVLYSYRVHSTSLTLATGAEQREAALEAIRKAKVRRGLT